MQHLIGGNHFGFHQQPKHFFIARKKIGNYGRAGVGAVGGSERVVHIHITQFAQFFGKCPVARFFFFVKTQIFQQQHLAGSHHAKGKQGLLANTIVGKKHMGIAAQQFLQVGHQVLKAAFVFGAIFGASQMTHQNHFAAVGQYFFDGGYGGGHARIVGNGQGGFVEGHVKIDPNQGFLTLKIVVAESTHGCIF